MKSVIIVGILTFRLEVFKNNKGEWVFLVLLGSCFISSLKKH